MAVSEAVGKGHLMTHDRDHTILANQCVDIAAARESVGAGRGILTGWSCKVKPV